MVVTKIYKEGNQIVVDIAGAKNGRQSEGHASHVFARQAYEGDVRDAPVTADHFVISSPQIGTHVVKISPEFQNKLGVPYTRNSWIDFYRVNTGFNPASGGSGAGRSFTYQATDYTDLTTNVAPVANEDELAIVYNSQGIWPINRRLKGVWIYQLGAWEYANQELQDILAGKEDNLNNPTADGHVLSSTAAGVRSWVNSNLNLWQHVLLAEDLNDQVPLGTNQPLKVQFGPAQSLTFFDVSAAGDITCNIDHQYFFRARLSIGRVTNPSDSIIFIRSVIVPAVGPTILGRPVVYSLSGDDIIETFEFTAELDMNVGDVIYVEFYRDQIGANDGQLRTAPPSLAGWTQTASATMTVWKVGDI